MQSTETKNNRKMKRLVLDTANKKIAGVCAGVANYLDIDVTVVRVIFLASLIIGGIGLWTYLVIWAIAPTE